MKRIDRLVWCLAAIILAIVALGARGDSSGAVQFPDPALAEAVHDSLNIPTNQNVLIGDMQALNQLGTSLVKNFSGLEYATNLSWLSTQLANESDLSALSMLQGLHRLDVSALSPLTDARNLLLLTNLLELYADRTGITNVEVLAHTSLKRLGASGLHVTNASVFSSFTNLFALDVSFNEFHDLRPFVALTNLIEFEVDFVPLTNVVLITNMPQLYWLFISGQNLKDCSLLTNLTHLAYLHIGLNELRDISPLRHLTNLHWLNISENRVGDVGVITNLPLFQFLYAYDNCLTNIPRFNWQPGRSFWQTLDLRHNFLDLRPGTPLREAFEELKSMGIRVNTSLQAMPGNIRLVLANVDDHSITLRFETDPAMVFNLERWDGIRWMPERAAVHAADKVVLPTTGDAPPSGIFRAAPAFLPVQP